MHNQASQETGMVAVVLVIQARLAVCDPKDGSQPGSSVYWSGLSFPYPGDLE